MMFSKKRSTINQLCDLIYRLIGYDIHCSWKRNSFLSQTAGNNESNRILYFIIVFVNTSFDVHFFLKGHFFCTMNLGTMLSTTINNSGILHVHGKVTALLWERRTAGLHYRLDVKWF